MSSGWVAVLLIVAFAFLGFGFFVAALLVAAKVADKEPWS